MLQHVADAFAYALRNWLVIGSFKGACMLLPSAQKVLPTLSNRKVLHLSHPSVPIFLANLFAQCRIKAGRPITPIQLVGHRPPQYAARHPILATWLMSRNFPHVNPLHPFVRAKPPRSFLAPLT